MKFISKLVKKLDTIIELLTAEKEAREAKEQESRQEERDKMLLEYALKHNKKYPTGGVHSSREVENLPVREGKDYVPYGLNEIDKEILRMWYGTKNDNR